jgi:hypothetical protein
MVAGLVGAAYGVALAERGPSVFASFLFQAADTATPTLTLAPTRTRTPVPSLTPTETLIPPIDIPTLESFAPYRETWVDLPSYPLERALMTQLYFDPDVWALTPDQFGNTVLAHRTIPYCQIARAAARGLLPGWTADSTTKKISSIFFDVVTVSENGTVRYLNYFTAGKIAVKTGFEVAFVDDKDACITAAETVLASLSFVAATPTSTPTETPTDTATPEPSATVTP